MEVESYQGGLKSYKLLKEEEAKDLSFMCSLEERVTRWPT